MVQMIEFPSAHCVQGLKRLSEDAIKELYPATTDTWAEPVSSDDKEMALIRPMLAQTAIESAPLRLAYDADRDGWTAEAFHAAVNTFGAAVVIAETSGGAVLGGYNPSGARLDSSIHRTVFIHVGLFTIHWERWHCFSVSGP